MGSGDVTLYARWSINGYSVNFDSNGGSAVSSQSVNYGGHATAPTAPTKTGYSFGGWYTDNNYTTAFDFANTAITGSTTVYAKWTANAPSSQQHFGNVMYGMSNSDVAAIQKKLSELGYNPGPMDGIFGPKTLAAVESFQQNKGLQVDGIVGPITWAALFGTDNEVSDTYPGLVMFGMVNDNVAAVQRKLEQLGYNPGPVDGIFGTRTLAAVKSFQQNKGLRGDGVVGPITWHALFN